MNPADLKKSIENPQFIPGIYNYCDRWCERCPFTSRCLNCSLAEKQFGGLLEMDQFNDEFWDKFNQVLEDTFTLVQETAMEFGFDPQAINELIDDEINDGDDDDENLTHLIVHASERYAEMVDVWFDGNESFFEEKEDEMMALRVVAPGDNPEKEIDDINDAAEVIRWYQHQIGVKLQRAIRSCIIEDQHERREGVENHLKDSDGSAKVALIGIERSISAWQILLKLFPELEEQFLDLIGFLKSLLKRVDAQFPRARLFVRPGFDEIGTRASP